MRPKLRMLDLVLGHTDMAPSWGNTVFRIPQNYIVHSSLTEGALLGYAVAHEIGHVLLSTGGHENFGVMKARWGFFDESLMAIGHLRFNAKQSIKMRATLTTLAQR